MKALSARPIFAQVTDAGNIECLYHGWQFNGADGACVRVPQVCFTPLAELPRGCSEYGYYPSACLAVVYGYRRLHL